MTRPERPGYTNTGCYPARSACFWLIAPSVPASPLPYLMTKALRCARVRKRCIKAPARVMVVIAVADLSSSEEAPPPKTTQCLQSAGDGWLLNGCSLGRWFVLVWPSADALTPHSVFVFAEQSISHVFTALCAQVGNIFFFCLKRNSSLWKTNLLPKFRLCCFENVFCFFHLAARP